MRSDAIIPDYDRFFNEKALIVMRWALEENHRLKRTRLWRAACKMEYYYRINQTGYAGKEINRAFGYNHVKFAQSPLLSKPPKTRPRQAPETVSVKEQLEAMSQ